MQSRIKTLFPRATAAALGCALAMLAGCSGHGNNGPNESTSAPTVASDTPHTAANMTDAEIKYGVSPTRNKDVTYQDDVIVMEHGAEAIRSLSSNGLTYTIDANAPGAKDIQPDKILFATGRVVGRVLEVKRGGDGVAVTLGPVELTDVFKEAHISYHGTLDPAKMIVYQAPPDYPGTFIDQDAADPSAPESTPADPSPVDPASSMRQPGKTLIRVGSLSPAGELISLHTALDGTQHSAWADSNRERFQSYAVNPVSVSKRQRGDSGCDDSIAASAIARGSLEKKPGCGGSGGTTIADIPINGAHFIPDFSQGLAVTTTQVKDGLTFTAYAGLLLNRPDFVFNLNISGGRLNTAEIEVGINGKLKVDFKGGTGGEFKNFNKITEIPVDASFPIPGIPVPFAATFHNAILIQTMFTVKRAVMNVSGEYTLSGTVKAGIVNGKPAGSAQLSLTVDQSLADSLSGVSLGVNGLVLGYSGKIIAGIGAYSFVVGPYASLNTTVGSTRGSDQQGLLMGGSTCRSAEFHMWLAYGVGVAVPKFVVKILNGVIHVITSVSSVFTGKAANKAAISSSYSTELGKVIIKDIMEYIPVSCAPKA